MRKWRKQLFAFLVTGLLLLAGCGGNGSNENETGNGNNGADNGEEKAAFTIGITQIADHPSLNAATEGFKQALSDAGLEVTFDEQNAQGDPNTAKTIAQNLVGAEVDLIFANATPAAQAALSETKDIPIVFTSVTDPVGAELVESMEAPGGNLTGTADMHPDSIPNTVEFIQKYFNGSTIGTIYNAGEQNSVKQIEVMEEALAGSGWTLVTRTVSNTSEVKQAADSLAGEVDVIFIVTDNTVVSALEAVISVAEEQKIPLFVGEHDSVKRGGFAAYGFDYYDIGYEAGQLAVQILKEGKSPAELPAQYPQNLTLLINKQAAEKMGIELLPEWDDIAEYVE